MADQIEDIKSKLDIVEVIREYFPLNQAGGNFRARCPFHDEKTASFMVSKQKQIWHCFGGCNDGGDVFKFIMKHEGMEFTEALRYLAAKAGVHLERQDPKMAGQKTRLMDVLDAAAYYFHQALLKAPQADHARAYIEKRIPDQSLIDEFNIGYALNDPTALSNYLISKKFTALEIIEAGLSIQKDRGSGLIDRFRNRIIIPIKNMRGDVIGFGGRTLDEGGTSAKYINSPQTSLYDKSKTLFNLDLAKHDIRNHDTAIIVEGYMDTIAVYGAGMKHVVASSGTALTLDQIRLLGRFTKNFLFAFDMDTAGIQATLRGIENALQEGMNVKVIQLQKNSDGSKKYKDPDECIRADAHAWEESVGTAQSFMEFYFDHILTPAALTDGFEKRRCTRQLLQSIQLLPDRIEQDHWIRTLATRLNLSEKVLWEELGASRIQSKLPEKKQETSKFAKTPSRAREELLLALLIKVPGLVISIVPRIRPEMITSLDYRPIYDTLHTIVQSFEQSPDVIPEMVAKACVGEAVDRLVLLADKEWSNASEHELAQTAGMIADLLCNEYMRIEINRLQSAMRDAEKRNDREAMEEFARQFSSLQDF